MRTKVIKKAKKARRRAVKMLGLCLAVALVGAGGLLVVSKLRDSAPELQRPDLLIAMGICVAVWLGGASSEEASPEA
jgi:hypothetical protein